MIKLRATWNIPGDALADEADEAFAQDHVPAVRALEGIRRHNVLRFLRDVSGSHPAWWRGEELFFDDLPALDAAAASPGWSACWDGRFTSLIAGPSFLAFSVEEEFQPADVAPPAPAGTTTALSGIWQVPARLTPDEVDDVYLHVHIPGVRGLPRLRRHTVMKAVDWPAGAHARAWRSAEIRFDSRRDFDEVFASPEYDPIRRDGFTASVAGPDIDIYLVEEEWTPAGG